MPTRPTLTRQFGMLYRNKFRQVLNCAARAGLATNEDRECVCHEAFARAWSSILENPKGVLSDGGELHSGKALALIRMTVRNLAIDHYRKRVVRENKADWLKASCEEYTEWADPEVQLLRLAKIRKMQNAMEGLRPRQREVVRAIFHHEHTLQTIAARMGFASHSGVLACRNAALGSLRLNLSGLRKDL